ncbi:MAG: hypothetical protein DMF61_05935 [Blastocatellia bacterium AA13]|nr:MAG: hypothetical protein DMF61_05935 [Blastocatellia bacterium AA13]
MAARSVIRLLLITIASLILCNAVPSTGFTQSTEKTLKGEWALSFSPIDGQLLSRKGNSLGFSDRHIQFDEEQGLRTSIVTREDIDPTLHPLGDWRINGDSFSATFQLYCITPDLACGTVTLRGRFTDIDKIRGTATVFFEQEDTSTPTGLDTWTMSFRGLRTSGGSN